MKTEISRPIRSLYLMWAYRGTYWRYQFSRWAERADVKFYKQEIDFITKYLNNENQPI